MPVYVFECPNCLRQKDLLVISHKEAQDTIMECENERCEGQKMKHIIAPTSFILKGPGWAKDGYSK